MKEISTLFDKLLNDYTYKTILSEGEFRNVIDSILKIRFKKVNHEVVTKNGILDTIITEESRIFLIEYKYNVNSSIALQQINDREYYWRYLDAKIPGRLLGLGLRVRQNPKLDIYYSVAQT
jgi:hypothetical protein